MNSNIRLIASCGPLEVFIYTAINHLWLLGRKFLNRYTINCWSILYTVYANCWFQQTTEYQQMCVQIWYTMRFTNTVHLVKSISINASSGRQLRYHPCTVSIYIDIAVHMVYTYRSLSTSTFRFELWVALGSWKYNTILFIVWVYIKWDNSTYCCKWPYRACFFVSTIQMFIIKSYLNDVLFVHIKTTAFYGP